MSVAPRKLAGKPQIDTSDTTTASSSTRLLPPSPSHATPKISLASKMPSLDLESMKKYEGIKRDFEDLERKLVEERARFRETLERRDKELTILRQKYNRKQNALVMLEKMLVDAVKRGESSSVVKDAIRALQEESVSSVSTDHTQESTETPSVVQRGTAAELDDYRVNDDEGEESGGSDAENGMARERIVRWKRGDQIGSGAYGVVYLGLNLDTGELLAVKSMSLEHHENSTQVQTEVLAIQQEIQLLQKLRHPNIVRYVGTEFRSQEFNVLLEFVPGGSIAKLVSKFGSLNEKVVRMYIYQVLVGLDYLHDNRIVHRDIKGANILVDHSGHVKLADFGCSKNIQDIVTPRGLEGEASIQGTPYWMAPEVIMGAGHRRESDIWSVGCVIIEMATGKPPFSEFSPPVTALYHIGTSEEPPKFPEKFSDAGLDFLKLCFQRDPKQRPGARFLLQHPWMQGLDVMSPSMPVSSRPRFGSFSTNSPKVLPNSSVSSLSSSGLASTTVPANPPSSLLVDDFMMPHFSLPPASSSLSTRARAGSKHGEFSPVISDKTRQLALALLHVILPERH